MLINTTTPYHWMFTQNHHLSNKTSTAGDRPACLIFHFNSTRAL